LATAIDDQRWGVALIQSVKVGSLSSRKPLKLTPELQGPLQMRQETRDVSFVD
jgi:hypothetical protein